ncbi:MAG TPA: CBS domain-containing protein [Pirellulaceae bacterium]
MQQILRVKGHLVHSIGPEASLADVVQSLVAKNCGSLMVRAQDAVVGIITERDILRACAEDSRPLSQILVHERMTRDLVVAGPDSHVSEIMGLMTERRIRHLPIMDGPHLLGMISIGDVVKAQHDHLTLENHYLKEYLQS